MIGHHESIEWEGQSVEAWVPALLVVRDLDLDTRTLNACRAAEAALVDVDSRFPNDGRSLSLFLARTENRASGQIDHHEDAGQLDTAAWRTRVAGPLTIERLQEWHRLAGGRGPFRTELTWLHGSSPNDATYVPPPPGEVPRLIEDLLRYANADSVNVVAQAAAIHAQFEAIHPFDSNNGVVGRILLHWLFRRRGVIDRLTVPISVAMANDLGGYLSGLTLFREGLHQPWMQWFAKQTQQAARVADRMQVAALQLVDDWHRRAEGLRRDSAGRRLIPLLVEHRTIDAATVAERLGVTERAARTALHSLVECTILRPLVEVEDVDRERGRPRHVYEAWELADIMSPM